MTLIFWHGPESGRRVEWPNNSPPPNFRFPVVPEVSVSFVLTDALPSSQLQFSEYIRNPYSSNDYHYRNCVHEARKAR